MAYPLGNSTIKPFSTTLDERRAKLAAHILRSSDNDPMRQVTYKPGSADAVEVGTVNVVSEDLGSIGLSIPTNLSTT